MANIFRRFDMKLDGVRYVAVCDAVVCWLIDVLDSSLDLKWIDQYVPLHVGPDMHVRATPVVL